MTYLILLLHVFYFFLLKLQKGLSDFLSKKKERENLKLDNNKSEALTGMMLNDSILK